MSHTVQVNDTITAIRDEFDIQTAAQATSQFPDAMLERWIDRGYRALFDLLRPRCGLERLGVQTTLTAPSFTLPSDLMHVLGIDVLDGGELVRLEPWAFGERNDFASPTTRPRWRVVSSALVWRPEAPTTSVVLWHIPRPASLAAGGSFDAINGWDDFILYHVGRRIKQRQDYGIQEVEALLRDARERVIAAACAIGDVVQVADVATESAEAYYNG